MYNHNPQSEGDQANLDILEGASSAPAEAYESDAEVRAAFDAELRKMAEEIVQYHPSLTQLLLSMGPKPEGESAPPLNGRN